MAKRKKSRQLPTSTPQEEAEWQAQVQKLMAKVPGATGYEASLTLAHMSGEPESEVVKVLKRVVRQEQQEVARYGVIYRGRRRNPAPKKRKRRTSRRLSGAAKAAAAGRVKRDSKGRIVRVR